MTTSLIVALLVLLPWFWYHNLRIRENAIRHAQQTCRREGYQLLDETVSLQAMRPCRNRHGRMALQRTYRFEYSECNTDRKQGFIIMLGAEMVTLGLAEAEATRLN